LSSNVSVVARGIAAFQGDPEVKACLMALFNYEMQQSALKNPPYKSTYVRELDKHLDKWKPAGESN
jgi:hypothetical protein